MGYNFTPAVLPGKVPATISDLTSFLTRLARSSRSSGALQNLPYTTAGTALGNRRSGGGACVANDGTRRKGWLRRSSCGGARATAAVAQPRAPQGEARTSLRSANRNSAAMLTAR